VDDILIFRLSPTNQEAIVEKTITVMLTPEGNLELPPEIRAQFSNGEQYSVVTTEDTIVFKKVPKFDWDKLRQRREELGEDPDQMTIEEICEIVREVRREKSKK
jgi:hypothetical protein